MALMSAWYFTEKVTLWPYTGEDELTHERSYSSPVVILCGIEDVSKLSRDMSQSQRSEEFMVTTAYYTGYSLVKPKDMIQRGVHSDMAGSEEVRNVKRHGMKAFGYDDEYTIEV